MSTKPPRRLAGFWTTFLYEYHLEYIFIYSHLGTVENSPQIKNVQVFLAQAQVMSI